MLDQFIKRTQTLLGIDISSAAVKVLELSKLNKRYRVESYAVMPFPQGAVIEKNIKDSEAVTKAIQKTLRTSKTNVKNAATAIPDSHVITKLLHVDPELSDEDIETHIVYEADKYIPYPLEEVSIDFAKMGPNHQNTNQDDVLVIASRTEHVSSRVKALEEAGLSVRLVDVESYAVERACHLLVDNLPNRGVDQTIAVVDIGAAMTNLTVLYNMSTVFTRDELFGGMRLTEDIMRHYGLTYEEAGIAKKQGNMPDDYEVEILAPFKEAVVLQVRRALQFFFSSSQHTKVDQVLLAGGTASMPGLVELVQENIGVPTAIANPFVNMVIANRVDSASLIKDAPALMIACGLALRSFMTCNKD